VVVVTALSPAGREAVLGLLGHGQVFGQSSLAAGRQRATARALGRSVVRVVDVASVVLVDAAGVGPVGSGCHGAAGSGTAVQLAGALAARCDVLEEWLADLVLLDVPARLAKRLCELMELAGRRVPQGVLLDVPLTQGQLASLAAAARESVNRAIAALTREGVLGRVDRRYVVRDVGALRRLAGRSEEAAASAGGWPRW
jgi:CRP/FNR family transcriptional regulator, cyclic AMP receptor protein